MSTETRLEEKCETLTVAEVIANLNIEKNDPTTTLDRIAEIDGIILELQRMAERLK